MKKDTFILQTGYKKLFSMLSDEEAGQVIKAVFDYEAEECPAQLEGAALMLFTVICEQLDKYRESYEKTCEANRKNGSKGGRPSGPAETQANPEKPSNSLPAEQEPKEETKNPKKPKKPNGLSEKPKEPNGDDNELDLDSDSERDKEKKREKDPPKSPQGDSQAETSPVMELPLLGGESFAVGQGDVEEWQSAYPSVSVMQELRKMRVWLDANPGRRKKPAGVKRFITGWLSKTQAGGGQNSVPVVPDYSDGWDDADLLLGIQSG